MFRLRVPCVLLLLAAGCSSAGSPQGTTTPPILPPVTTSPTEPPGEPATTTSVPEEEGPDPLLAEIGRLQRAVEEVRRLEFLEEPEVTVLSAEEVAERVRDLVDEELPFDEVRRDQALLVVLGLLEPDQDLRQLYLDLYAEQVAGFYDGDTRELVVPASQEELSPYGRFVLFHELVHAVTDQHFGFHERFVRLDEEERFDESSAFQALIEGDATHFQLVYLSRHLTPEEQLELHEEALQQEHVVFDRAPRFLRDLLIFPYDTGSTFVSRLVGAEGVEMVDRTYGAPPVSTEQVIHPDKFLAGEEPEGVTLPDTQLSGFEVAEESVWGELGFQVTLHEALGFEEARTASAGWGGDRYRVLWDGEDRVGFVLRYLGDAEAETVELFEAMAAFVGDSMDVGEVSGSETMLVSEGPGAYALLARSGRQLDFVAASEAGAGRELRRALDAG